jgi:putative peptide zinc metalloprotease protein
MRESLFSPMWYRYSKQIPKIKANVELQKQQYRDQTWYLLVNTQSENHFRINAAAYAFVGRCTGGFNVQEIWDSLLETLGDDAPTQDEVIRLLNELDQKDVLRYEVMPDVPQLFKREKEKANKQRNAFINPLAFRFPLFNPTKLLNRLDWLHKLVFNPFVFVLWLVTVLAGFIYAIANWNALAIYAKMHVNTPHYLLIAWIIYPFIKSIHELGHALAVKHWGGEVRETGITLFMLTPAPYVDASASSGFRFRHQRALVAAIGIMIELLIAVLMMWLFFNVQPGLVRDTAFVAAFIASVSSFLFNGNPLVRFDAYYVLCDIFDLPNLAARSRAYWTNIFVRLVHGKKNVQPLFIARGEQKWLFSYAPLSFTYSALVFFSVVLWLGSKSQLIGLFGLVFVTFGLLVKPLLSVFRSIIAAAPAGVSRLKAKLLMATGVAALLAFIFILPIPFNTNSQGVIWIPDEAKLRTESPGYITEIAVKNNQLVKIGDLLVKLENPSLITEREQLQSQLAKLEGDQFNALFKDRSKSVGIEEQIKKLKSELAHNAEKIAALDMHSLVNGKMVIPHADDIKQTYIKKGTVIGYVLDNQQVNLRVALQAPDLNLIREKLVGIEVRTAENPQQLMRAELVSITPSATRELPSAALGDRAGGSQVTDPTDKAGIKALNPIILVDLKLPSAVFERAGGRVNVRFNHGTQPLAMQFYRKAKQLFLSYFNPNL